ncbi:hypothetical protein X941_5616 [Burkholderia pseudomallei MSHR5569]|nr:hypothetical protein X941_5616 [Burkholderia pseudomallei MSHR5569]
MHAALVLAAHRADALVELVHVGGAALRGRRTGVDMRSGRGVGIASAAAQTRDRQRERRKGGGKNRKFHRVVCLVDDGCAARWPALSDARGGLAGAYHCQLMPMPTALPPALIATPARTLRFSLMRAVPPSATARWPL